MPLDQALRLFGNDLHPGDARLDPVTLKVDADATRRLREARA